MKLKIFINYICFILLIFFTSSILTNILLKKEDRHSRVMDNAFYEQKKNSLDFVFIGASSTFTSWVPLYAWKKYGIYSLLYTSSGMPVGLMEYVIKEVNKTQNPKAIIINIDSICDSHVYNDLECICIHRLINKMKPSLNKYLMIFNIKNIYNLKTKDIIEFYLPIIRFHSYIKYPKYLPLRYYEFHESNMMFSYLDEFYYILNNTKTSNNYEPMVDLEENSIYNKPYFEEYYKEYILNHLFQYLSTLDNVILVNTRIQYNETKERHFNAQFKYIFNLADKYNIQYIDLSDIETNKKMGIKKNDYLNSGHFNILGAIKYTNYLAKILKNKYNIQDKRQIQKSKEWNTAYQDYINYIYYKHIIGNIYNCKI